MTVSALVVAGGQGSRMARSGADRPKPLMEVAGASLLERNVDALLRADIRHIHVAVSAGATDIVEHVEAACRPRAVRAGASLTIITEHQPLGSMGALASLPGDVEHVLVVNADNLTSIDLGEVIDTHRRHDPAVTLAVHDEPFHMPFGQVSVEAEQVTAYVEKPTYTIRISSAVTVVGRAAIDLVQPAQHVMLPELVQGAIDHGLAVRALHHTAPWIDVNDLDALRRAEELVARYPSEFALNGGVRG